MLTGILAKFRMAEWASTCMDRTYLQLRFELPSALASKIAFAGMAEDSNPLGSRGSPTVDVPEPSSLFARGSERYICRSCYLNVKTFRVSNFWH